MYLAVGVNNPHFLPSRISPDTCEQLNFMGLELRERGRDIRWLKNINYMILNNMGSGLLAVDNEGRVLQFNENAKAILASMI